MNQPVRKDPRELPLSVVSGIAAALKRPEADKTQIAAEFHVDRSTVICIDAGDHPALRRSARCLGCGAKVIDANRPCLVCSIRRNLAKAA